jgi:hypothetical protein
MNTFWLKLTAAAVGIVVIIVLIGTFTSKGSNQSQPEKTFYDQADQDKEKYLAEPKPEKSQEQTATTQQTDVNGVQTSLTQAPAQQAAPAQPAQAPAEQTKPTILYFKKLSEIDDIEAQRLLNVAVPGRSIGRLPMTGFNLMVQNCREIIKRWPDSWYAYRAKQMLGDLPERYKMRYKVTEEEMDLSMYYRQRPGTEPFTMEGTR